jgi:hypothetical protein
MAIPLGCHVAHGVPATLDGLGVSSSYVGKHPGFAQWISRHKGLPWARTVAGRSAIAHTLLGSHGGP